MELVVKASRLVVIAENSNTCGWNLHYTSFHLLFWSYLTSNMCILIDITNKWLALIQDAKVHAWWLLWWSRNSTSKEQRLPHGWGSLEWNGTQPFNFIFNFHSSVFHSIIQILFWKIKKSINGYVSLVS